MTGVESAVMSKTVIVAWVFVVGCVAAALVSLVVHPLHWERTLGLAVVLGVAVGVYALRGSRGRTPA